MTAKDRAVVARWRGLLAIRKGLLAAARKRHEWNPTPASRALLDKRKAQVAYAERVIARRTRSVVAYPLPSVTADTWGYHPPVHDGVDLICNGPDALYAICDAEVIDVRAGGWWGKAPTGNVSLGDGIIQLRCLVNAGPFRKGQHFGYGHAEKATVKVGRVVKAGDLIGYAGLANAYHTHFMVNDGQTNRGVGTRDPRPFLEYAERKGKR